LDELDKIRDLIVRFVRYNDQLAAREFFYFFYERLIKIAMIYVHALDVAEDVVSDVFAKLFRKKEKLLEIDDLRYYLYKCVKNESYLYLRKKRYHVDFEEIQSTTSASRPDPRNPESELLTSELSDYLDEIIEGLPNKRRQVYKLISEEQLRYKEVAELLDISVKTVEAHMALAVKEIRSKISAYLSGSEQSQPFFRSR
jgi:RNA polymerase sigma-70 factor (ECF subfamily)